jgi:uncharacterized protein (DUF58 family)
MILAVSVATLFLAVSAVVPWMAWLGLGVDAALCVAALADHRWARRADLSARRVWPAVLTQGSTAAIEVRLSAIGRGRTVAAREALHPGLAAGPLRTRLSVTPGRESVWTYEVTPRTRGAHRVGPLTVRVLGPLGLAWAQRDIVAPETRRVYPRLRWDGRVGRLLRLAHRRELGRAPLRVHGAGREPYALRAYQPGDPPTRIHWKATARQGRLVSREDAWERGGRLVVLLDAGRAMASLDGGQSKLDHALAAALALSRVALSRGDRVTLLAFSSRPERLLRLAPRVDAVARAYGALFDLEARLVEPAYDVAIETALAAEPRRSTVVVFTSVVDLSASETLREALVGLSRRHQPVLVNLEDPEVGRLARASPSTPEEAFAKVACLEVLLGNRALSRRLARAGVRTVSAPADRLALESLQAYLKLSAAERRS